MNDYGVIVGLSVASGVIVLILGILTVWLVSERLISTRTRRVIQSYAPNFSREVQADKAEGNQEGVSKIVQGLNSYATKQVEEGGLSLKPNQWLMAQFGLGVVATLATAAITKNLLIGSIVGLLVGILGPKQLVSSRLKKRMVSFEEELPETLMLVASALRSGLSFQQALESTVAERNSELGKQIRLAINESKLGPPLEESLNRVADRMQSEDLRWLVAALEIQREVGGALSTILDTAATTIKGREELRREVRSLSAEGRLSAYVLIALPLGIFAFLAFSRPVYVQVFWTETLGMMMFGGVLVMMLLGWVWMRKMIQIKV